MRYQLQLWDGLTIEGLTDRLADAAWSGLGGSPGQRGGAAREVRTALARRALARDVCGFQQACTDAAVPATPEARAHPAGPRREVTIVHLELPEGLEAFVAELAAAAATGAGSPREARGITGPLAAVLAPHVFRNELCGSAQCERVASAVPVFTA